MPPARYNAGLTMNSNPALKKLGFAESDRVVIIHTDDIGVSHASHAACTDLWTASIISSSAVMVPCAWFPKVAAYCRSNSKVDMGVHITLTCEYDNYRWGPVSSREARTGMLDTEGFLPRTSAEIQANGDPDAVGCEMLAQVERAIAAGIQPTHADTHMGTVFHHKFFPTYVQIARQFKIPVMIPRLDEDGLKRWGFTGDAAAWALNMLREMEEDNLPLLDHIAGMPLDKPEHRIEQVFAAIDALQPGLTHFIIHPSHDTPEARAMSPDLPSRIGDYETFMDERVRQHLKNAGVQVIGYRDLKTLMQ
jgi:predicted glycoside hydrolase/deacetylase ChbG (UPF0249 family)